MSEYIYWVEAKFNAFDDSFLLNRREEIVRCKDCKHYKTGDAGSYCCKSITTLHNPDGFCAWGERKENGDD